MPFSEFDAPTKALLISAFDLAWLTFKDKGTWSVGRRADTTAKLTGQLLAAADAGERDRAKLVKAALKGIAR